MPWLSVYHTRLLERSAVPMPDLALEVQRGSMPGLPGGIGAAPPGCSFMAVTLREKTATTADRRARRWHAPPSADAVRLLDRSHRRARSPARRRRDLLHGRQC